MTNSGISGQTEDQAHCAAGRPLPTPKAWAQTLLVPAQCVTAIVTIHTTSRGDTASLHIEVADAHTKELLAAWCNPAHSYGLTRSLPASVATELRAMLIPVMDPDPF